MGFHCLHQVWIQVGNQVIIELLLSLGGKGSPRKIVNVPCVIEVDIGKYEADGSFVFGEKGDEKV